MPTDKDSITPEEREDARRLKTAFEAHQQRLRLADLPYTQFALEPLIGLKQSAMSQYLNGSIKLNMEALLKFCQVLGVAPESISPRLVEEERKKRAKWSDRSLIGLSTEALDLAEKFDGITDPALRHVAYIKAIRIIGNAAKREADAAAEAPAAAKPTAPASAPTSSGRGTQKPSKTPIRAR